MNKILIILIIFNTFSFADQNFIIHIEKMHCPLCTSIVRKTILKVNGVKSAKVTLKDKNAVVITKDNLKIDEILNSIEKIGYSGKVIK